WTVALGDGSNNLHYMLGWESLAEREQKWNAFQADPAWHTARDDSEKNGPLIANINSLILRPTAFSAIR
ncbi:MAG: NIPSNAP family protein, partial [Rhizobiales bacterium]|nr:NIPSNAP family protein [Hyphomicrobiales bacterium]